MLNFVYCKFELEMKVVVNSSSKYLLFNVRLVHSIESEGKKLALL